jgi:hypothetical protein
MLLIELTNVDITYPMPSSNKRITNSEVAESYVTENQVFIANDRHSCNKHTGFQHHHKKLNTQYRVILIEF